MKAVLDQTTEKMQKSIHALETTLGTIRAGRANPGLLDRVDVDYYGVPTKISQMAAVSVPEARMLMIQPWDASTLKEIERAIIGANLGVNPTNDGKVIRIVFPAPTQERRKELVKEAHKCCEEGKVAVRSIRRDANEKLKKLEKASELTKDDLADGEKQVQKLTDQFCKQIDSIFAAKEKEIMEL